MASNRTYGDFMRDMPGGLRNIGKPLTIAALVIALIGMLCCMANVVVAIVVIGVGEGTVAILAVRDRQHRNIADRTVESMAYKRSQRQGSHLYRSGMLAPVESGCTRLPGIMSQVSLIEADDAFGKRFTLVHHEHTGEYALLLSCQPQGASMADAEVEDRYVASWARFFEMLATEQGVNQMSVTVDTSPDSGVRFRRNMTRHMVADAPELAARCMQQVMAAYSQGGASTDTIVTLTYRYRDAHGKFVDADEAARRIGAMVPQLIAMIRDAGGGTARCLLMDEIVRMIACEYDPRLQEVLENTDDEDVYVDWQDAGPTAAEARWDYYRHDSAISRTWQMCDPPSSMITSSSLAALLSPMADVDRKRVTMIYHVVSPDKSAWMAEQNRQKAVNQISQEKRATMASAEAKARADRHAIETNQGAVIVYFGLLVTASVLAGDNEQARLEAASRSIENAAGVAKINLRPCYGAQDTGFAASTPLGFDVRSYAPASMFGLS